MRKLGLLVAVIFMVGCDTETSAKQITAGVVSQSTVNCNHFAYCFTCALGMDGKTNCGGKFSSLCPGIEMDTIEQATFEVTYKSGKRVQETRIVRVVKTGQCI